MRITKEKQIERNKPPNEGSEKGIEISFKEQLLASVRGISIGIGNVYDR